MAGYSKRTLAEKLGIPAKGITSILGAPQGFIAAAGNPSFSPRLPKHADYIHYFTTEKEALTRQFPRLREALAPAGILWISWPKKAAGVPTDLTENSIRDIGLANGLVDVKVAAIDEVWSGLKFVYRLKDRV